MESSPDPSPPVVPAPVKVVDGDIILVIGPQKQEFQVSSVILKLASKVFNAMLSDKFSEGQRLAASEGQPVEIALPEDDGEVFHHVLFPLHYIRIPDPPQDADLILRIARTVDKYDLQNAMGFLLQYWLEGFGVLYSETYNEEFTEKCWRIALAAFILQRNNIFRDATKALILCAMDYRHYVIQDSSRGDRDIQLLLACCLEKESREVTTNLLHFALRPVQHIAEEQCADMCFFNAVEFAIANYSVKLRTQDTDGATFAQLYASCTDNIADARYDKAVAKALKCKTCRTSIKGRYNTNVLKTNFRKFKEEVSNWPPAFD